MGESALRVAIIGIGWFARGVLVPGLRETGRAEIVAISRRNTQRLLEAKAELDVPNAYTDWRSCWSANARKRSWWQLRTTATRRL